MALSILLTQRRMTSTRSCWMFSQTIKLPLHCFVWLTPPLKRFLGRWLLGFLMGVVFVTKCFTPVPEKIWRDQSDWDILKQTMQLMYGVIWRGVSIRRAITEHSMQISWRSQRGLCWKKRWHNFSWFVILIKQQLIIFPLTSLFKSFYFFVLMLFATMLATSTNRERQFQEYSTGCASFWAVRWGNGAVGEL